MGYVLANVKIPKKVFGWTIGAGIVSFFVMFIGVPGFNGVYWYQRLSGRSGVYSWNPRFLSNVTSPFLFLMVLAAFLIFRKVIVSFSAKEMRFFIPVVIFMDAPIIGGFVRSFRFTNSAGFNKFLMIIIMTIAAFILDYLYERYLFKFKPVKMQLHSLINMIIWRKLSKISGASLLLGLWKQSKTSYLGLVLHLEFRLILDRIRQFTYSNYYCYRHQRSYLLARD